MKAKLYREHSGKYALTRLEPIRNRVIGTRHTDYYVPPGDPVGFRHMCEEATMALTGGSCASEPMGAPIDVEVFIVPAAGMTSELRKAIEEAQRK